jgi:hypothetical protein
MTNKEDDMDRWKETVLNIVKNTTLTHQQAMMNLADAAVSQEGFWETSPEFDRLHQLGIVCDMSEVCPTRL